MPLDYPIRTRTLANGLRVVLSPDDLVPSVSINVRVGVGSRHEQPGRTGLAHLFEHLMFEGSEQVAEGEHFAALLAHGGRANATTSYDRTTYVESVPTGALELALWLEADRHGRLLPALTQATLDNQRDVVVEEKRQRYDNQPYGSALEHLGAAIFPEGHPYRHPTIGSMADLEAASLPDVHAFFRRHYRPDNTVVTLVGDVDPGTAFDLVERHLGAIPPAPPDTLPDPPPPAALGPLPQPDRLEIDEPVPSRRLYLAFRAPTAPSREFIAVALALDTLAGLEISRVQRRLVRDEEVATGCTASAMGLANGASLAVIVADVADDVPVEQVERALCEELRHLATEGPTSVELEASIADTERSWLAALASHDERAELLGHYAQLTGDPGGVNGYLDLVGQISAAEVTAAAARWLTPTARAAVRYPTLSEPTEDQDDIVGVA